MWLPRAGLSTWFSWLLPIRLAYQAGLEARYCDLNDNIQRTAERLAADHPKYIELFRFQQGGELV